ncbi:MAG: hypothetical protein N4A47_01485 [Clostridia bacterium]|jgi:hypothetical protein|nr:hypothetical protein [Clostridia bacterium]
MFDKLEYEEEKTIKDKENKNYKKFKSLVLKTIGNKKAGNSLGDYEVAMEVKANYGENENYRNLEILANEYDKCKNNAKLENHMPIKEERLGYAANEYIIKSALEFGESLNIDKKLMIETIIMNSPRYSMLSSIDKEYTIDYIETFLDEYPDRLELSTIITRLMNAESSIQSIEENGNAGFSIASIGNLLKISWEINREIIASDVVKEEFRRDIFNHEITHYLLKNYQKIYKDKAWNGYKTFDINSKKTEYEMADEGITNEISINITKSQGHSVLPGHEAERFVVAKNDIISQIDMKKPFETDEDLLKEIEKDSQVIKTIIDMRYHIHKNGYREL